MKPFIFLTLIVFCSSGRVAAQSKPIVDTSTLLVPLGGNAWVNKSSKAEIKEDGLFKWTNTRDTASIWARIEATGPLEIALRLRVPGGKSKIRLTVNRSEFVRQVTNTAYADIQFGKIMITRPGYIRFDLQGISKTDTVFAQVAGLVLKGNALANGTAYVKNNEGNYFYWGRRGPSVHLNYKNTPDNIEWFYNELTVPVGDDTQGSYFMANGFENGYFGMQVNSPTERRVLFSIWSPFTTDDPKSIPDSLKVLMLKKGANVHAGEFGSEGSGGQSFMIYPWKAGKTYAFLTHAQPNPAKHTTIFTSYFKDKNAGSWQLIASFERPQTVSYLKRLHSFLENFDPEYGNRQRKANYGNGWAVDATGKWFELTDALFTGDATAKKNYRKDYSGGTEASAFYLRNCGFFNDFTPLSTLLHRLPNAGGRPVIDFDKLP
ncbi:DUF3472 domain-containing protein [soil metagenome]